MSHFDLFSCVMFVFQLQVRLVSVVMTTNGEEDVRAGNDGISGDVEASVPEVSCDKCRELTQVGTVDS